MAVSVGRAAMAAAGSRGDSPGPRLLHVRVLLPVYPGWAGFAGWGCLRGRRQPGGRTLAYPASGGAAAALPGSGWWGAPHLHDRARILQRSVHLRWRLSGDADANRGDPAERRRSARHDRNRVIDSARPGCAMAAARGAGI